MAPRPPPPSVAVSVTFTGPFTQLAGQAAPSQAIAVVGRPSLKMSVTGALQARFPTPSVTSALREMSSSESRPAGTTIAYGEAMLLEEAT